MSPSSKAGESPLSLAGYPSTLERDVASGDGTLRFRLRPIRPEDGQNLMAFHDGLSDRSCYLRFFSLHSYLSPKEVERFTHVDYEDRLALVAELDDRLIAVGRYDRRPERDIAEVAFVVADDYQHHGIGSLLLDELVIAARQRRISTFVADTLDENHSMLDVFFHSGFVVTSHLECGTVSIRFPLEPTEASEAVRAQRGASWRVTPVVATDHAGQDDGNEKAR